MEDNREEQAASEDNKVPKREILVLKGENKFPSKEQLAGSGLTKSLSGSTNERTALSNRWLDCMDKFADEIQNVEVPRDIQDGILKKDITVALIDDGADLYVESLRGKVIGGDSFDRPYPHENGPSPYYNSSTGHGTVMADMIFRVCPMTKLFVYKLETYTSINPTTQKSDQISADSAALVCFVFSLMRCTALANYDPPKAIRAAVDQNVDIISISWTIKETKDNHDGIAALRDAVNLALGKGILFFCSAADAGAIVENEYPWDCDQRRIFRIGAAFADGRSK